MSEPDSLYARMGFDPGRYRGFLDSVPAQPATFADWHAWLAGRETYGRPSSESAFSDPVAYPPIVDALLASWQSDTWLGMPPISIDDGCCRIVMLQATESYLELVRLLSPLRAAAAWTRADAGDIILVTNHLYDPGASPMACLAIGGGESRFVDVVPGAWRDEATAAFDATLSYMEQLHRDD